MAAYQMAMDDDCRIWIATRGPKRGPIIWERAPFLPSGMLRHKPVDAFAVPVPRPEWATLDFYLMFDNEQAEILAAADL